MKSEYIGGALFLALLAWTFIKGLMSPNFFVASLFWIALIIGIILIIMKLLRR